MVFDVDLFRVALRNGGWRKAIMKPIVRLKVSGLAAMAVTMIAAVGATGVKPNAGANLAHAAEEGSGARHDEAMRIVEVTGDSERITIRFNRELDKGIAEDPSLYEVDGRRPARVQATGFYAILKGLDLSPDEHRIRISEKIAALDGSPLAAESREVTYRYQYRRRRIKVSGVQPIPNWEKRLPLRQYLRYVLELVDEAGRRGSDIVCVPEAVMSEPGKSAGELAQAIPDGEYARLLAESARRHGMYVNAVVLERLGPRIGQTAVLLDRQGKVAGKYHKVFELGGKGILEGELLPVFETDFGVIGTMICMDLVSPEVPRILALKGAEMIFIPHGGGDHAGSEFQHILMARAYAVTNEVYVVLNGFGRDIDRAPRDVTRRNETAGPGNFGRTCVIARNGLILADAGSAPGVVTTEIDLEARRFVCGYGMAGINDAREALLRCVKLNVHEELYRVAKEVVARREAAGIPGTCDWEDACRAQLKQGPTTEDD